MTSTAPDGPTTMPQRVVGAIMVVHAVLAGVFILLLLSALVSMFSGFVPRIGLRPLTFLLDFVLAAVAVAGFALQLFLREGIRDGSRAAWVADVAFGALAVLAATALWVSRGFGIGWLLVVELVAFGAPVAVAGALLWAPVRARFHAHGLAVDASAD